MFGPTSTSSYAYYGGGARRESLGPGTVAEDSLYGGGAPRYQGSRRDSIGSEEAATSGGGGTRSRRTPGQLEPPCLPVTIAKLVRSLDRNGSCRLLKNVAENGPISVVGWALQSGVRLTSGESEFQLCDGTGVAAVRILMGSNDSDQWLLQRLQRWLAQPEPQSRHKVTHSDCSSDQAAYDEEAEEEADGAEEAAPKQKRPATVYLRVVGPAFQEDPPNGPIVLRAVHIREAAVEEAAFYHVLDVAWTYLRVEERLGKLPSVGTAAEKKEGSDPSSSRQAVESTAAEPPDVASTSPSPAVVVESDDIPRSCLGSEMELPGVLGNVRDKIERAVLQFILKNRRAPIGVPKERLVKTLIHFKIADAEAQVFKAIRSLEDAAFIMDTEDENVDVVLDDDEEDA